MRRLLILAAELCAFIIMAASVVLLWASHYIDTEEFRQQFAEVVEHAVGQPVSLDGELNIALYPSLSLEVLDLTVGGPSEFGDAPMVAFDELLVSVRLMPLLAREVEVRSIVVEGMEINVVRSKGGDLNWQTVLNRKSRQVAPDFKTGSQIEAISLSELEVVDATVNYEDLAERQSFSLKGIALRTGAIVPGKRVPFTAKSTFKWQDGKINSQLILKGIVESNGEGIKLTDSTIYASLGGDFLPVGANPGEMTAKLGVDVTNQTISLDGLRVRFLGLMAEGKLRSGNLAKELKAEGSFVLHEFKPVDIISRYAPKAPVDSVDGLRKGRMSSDFVVDESGVKLRKLKISLDDLAVGGSLAMIGYEKPVFSFNLDGNMVDLDRYLPLFRTGTPFIWDDFSLPLFGKFRGKGTVHASGFKVLDEQVSDVKVALDANAKGITASATAVGKGQGGISANAQLLIGTDSETSMPTFGGTLGVVMISPPAGFDFFNVDQLKLSGGTRLKADFVVDTMVCPPEVESIGILRNTSGQFALLMGKGVGQWHADKGKSYSLKYSNVDSTLKLSPFLAQGDEFYGFNVDSNIRLSNGNSIRTASLAVTGPLVVNIENGDLNSSGLNVRSSVTGALITDQQARCFVSGKVGFDSAKGVLDVKDATIRALETTLKGNAQVTDLKTSFKAKGNLELPALNVRRLVYLLKKFRLRTGDPEALKHITFKTDFTANKDGFVLDGLEGSLDGMAIKGNLTGKGYLDTQFIGSLAGGFLDIDRFIPDSEELEAKAKLQGKVYEPTPTDLPLAFLRWLNVNVKVWLEGLKLADIRATNVSGNISAHKGAINVANVKGLIHEGALQAGWVGEVGEKSLTTHLKMLVEDMQAGPLMVDMAGRDYVRGLSDVNINLKSSGATDDDIVENLNGSVRCRITNGSFKFSGYDAKAPKPEIENNGLVTSSDPKKRRTVFQKAIGDFTVSSGVFTVDKFRVEAPPLLQSYGKGWFNLPDDSIDLTIRNDFVAVPSVRIHLSGKLSDPAVDIPKTEIVTDTVRNILSIPEKSINFLRDLF